MFCVTLIKLLFRHGLEKILLTFVMSKTNKIMYKLLQNELDI